MEKKELELMLTKLHHILEDFEMLKAGTWIPDGDSCDASIDNVDSLIELTKKWIIINKF